MLLMCSFYCTQIKFCFLKFLDHCNIFKVHTFSLQVLHAMKKWNESLATLNKAIAMDPKNPLCKFHRASVFFSLDKLPEALKDLDELKEIVPKESLVYFLIGKVCIKFLFSYFEKDLIL